MFSIFYLYSGVVVIYSTDKSLVEKVANQQDLSSNKCLESVHHMKRLYSKAKQQKSMLSIFLLKETPSFKCEE